VVPLATPTCGDRAAARVAAIDDSGGRFSGAQHCEHGHRLVTSSMVGGVGPVIESGRQTEMGR
jgi:hypothetical protein